MDTVINVYVWNCKAYRNPNQKKTKNKKRVSEAVSAQTYSLQENRGGKRLYYSHSNTLHLFSRRCLF